MLLFFHKQASETEQGLVSLIRLCHRKTFKIYGYRRIKLWLQREQGITVNSKKLLRIMRKYHSSWTPHLIHPNLLNQNFEAQRKNKKWVTDITYTRTSQGVIYLSAILNLFDRSIVAYQISPSQNTELVINTLRSAYQEEKVAGELLLHSDQGTQYTSLAYQRLSKVYGITRSMSRRGNCYDNSIMEGFFSILKTEWIYRFKPKSFCEARRMIEEYIQFYNYQRIQQSGQTPLEVRNLSA